MLVDNIFHNFHHNVFIINVVIDVKSTNLSHFSSLNNPFRDVAAKNVRLCRDTSRLC